MMKIQEWLRNNGGNLELLEDQLGIKATRHDDGRVILNYSQIDSPKDNEIVCECRGLVLDSNDDWSLVARAFKRFFNVGEFPERLVDFKWSNSYGFHKEDGSLLLVYYWKGTWRTNTRASFAEGECNDIMTWHELALKALPNDFFIDADRNMTYVFELCSPYNKIVRRYDEPTVFLLSMFIGVDELRPSVVHREANRHGIAYPNYYGFFSIADVEGYIRCQANEDPTFEGIVLYDGNVRWKIKSPEYLALHRMANNGNPCHYKNLLPFILANETAELFSYFPEVEGYVYGLQHEIEMEWAHLERYWFCFNDEPSQRKFAEAIFDCKHKGILFNARKLGVEPRELFYNLEYLTKFFKAKFK